MARLLDEFPDVYDAYRASAVERLLDGKGESREQMDFNARREASRAERIRKAVSR